MQRAEKVSLNKGTYSKMQHEYRYPILARRYVLLLALVTTCVMVNHPGRLTPDSWEQLQQAENVTSLTDWHSPIVAWIWSFFAPLLGQPTSALSMQAILICLYPSFSMFEHVKRGLNAKTILASTLSYFFVCTLIVLSGLITKDVLLSALLLCLLLSVANLSRRSTPENRDTAELVLFCLLVLAVRPTNFLLAIVALLITVSVYQCSTRQRTVAIIVSLLLPLSVPANNWISRYVFAAHPSGVERSLIIFDAAGISQGLNENVFTQLPGWRTADLPEPKTCYTPKQWDDFAWGACKGYSDEFDKIIREQSVSVVTWWISLIIRHPKEYIEHRLKYTYRLLINDGTQNKAITSTPPTFEAENGPDLDARIRDRATVGRDTSWKPQEWSPRVLFVPFGIIAARIFDPRRHIPTLLSLFSLGYLIWAFRKRRSPKSSSDLTCIAACAIAIGNIAMLSFLGVSDDGRYLLPTYACGMAGLIRSLKV